VSAPSVASSTSGSLSPELRWLAGALWPGSEVVERRGRATAAGAPLASFIALPDCQHSRLLVPARNRRAAAAALRQYNDGLSQVARVRKAVAGMALGLGAGRSVGGRVDVFLGTDRSSFSALSDELRRVFGGRRLELAVSLGERERPNRKPVLQVSTERGEVLGYVKVGWNDDTKRLVGNEADALRSMAGSPPETFRVPRLLHDGEVGSLRIEVLSPFRHRLVRRGALGAAPPRAAVHEVAIRNGTEIKPLSGSEFARALRERIGLIAEADRRDSVSELFDRVEDGAGNIPLAFGSCHGDWTPWNMSRTSSGLIVWDWERNARPVPLGFDVLHHRFQFAWRGGRKPLGRAIFAARRESVDTLSWLGVAESNHELVLRLYLLELIVRFEEGWGRPAIPRPSAELETALRERMARR
jgi:hypothetical protein